MISRHEECFHNNMRITLVLFYQINNVGVCHSTILFIGVSFPLSKLIFIYVYIHVLVSRLTFFIIKSEKEVFVPIILLTG